MPRRLGSGDGRPVAPGSLAGRTSGLEMAGATAGGPADAPAGAPGGWAGPAAVALDESLLPTGPFRSTGTASGWQVRRALEGDPRAPCWPSPGWQPRLNAQAPHSKTGIRRRWPQTTGPPCSNEAPTPTAPGPAPGLEGPGGALFSAANPNQAGWWAAGLAGRWGSGMTCSGGNAIARKLRTGPTTRPPRPFGPGSVSGPAARWWVLAAPRSESGRRLRQAASIGPRNRLRCWGAGGWVIGRAARQQRAAALVACNPLSHLPANRAPLGEWLRRQGIRSAGDGSWSTHATDHVSWSAWPRCLRSRHLGVTAGAG